MRAAVQRLAAFNFRQRIALLVGARRALWLPGIAALLWWRAGFGFWLVLGLCLLLALALKARETSLRRQFIREAEFPDFLAKKLVEASPQLTPRDADLVLRGLRQFFLAHLRSGRKFVAMPSKLVDQAWHEFILHTRGYQGWCAAAFGSLLHHTPAEVLGRDARRNDGLRRTWYWACKEESIDPRKPTRLPLLFALDAKFDVPGGFRYAPDCATIDRASGSHAHCGTSFSEASSGAGDAGSLGGCDAAPSSDGSDGGGSGCGGGCGGGGGGGGD